MRVIAGKAKGRQLKAPKGQETRPTAARVKEAIFSVLSQRLPGSHVLDAFAGSGALGIEALSRGAAKAVFIEESTAGAAVIKENIAKSGFSEQSRVYTGDFLRIIKSWPSQGRERFELVFLDPPYNKGLIAKSLSALADREILAEDALIVIETSAAAREYAQENGFFETIKESKYGDTAVIYLAWKGVPFNG